MKVKQYIPTEAEEQVRLINYLKFKSIPFYAIPNGGSRNAREAKNLKAQGVVAGVPDIMQAMFEGIAPNLKNGEALKSKTISCHIREGDMAPHLAQIQKNYDRVSIGSYPFFHDGNVGVSVVLRSSDEIQLQRAVKEVREAIEIMQSRQERA